jgi:hypothetical protein
MTWTRPYRLAEPPDVGDQYAPAVPGSRTKPAKMGKLDPDTSDEAATAVQNPANKLLCRMGRSLVYFCGAGMFPAWRLYGKSRLW